VVGTAHRENPWLRRESPAYREVMLIRELNPLDDTEFERFHEVYVGAQLFERPWGSVQSLHDHRVEMLDDDPGERHIAVVAVDRAGEVGDPGGIVGVGIVYLPVSDNRHLAWMELGVLPEHRRRGIGSSVLDHLVELCRLDGRTDLVLETAYPFEARGDHPYRRFCERHGFALANTEVRRHLALPVEQTLLDALIEEAAAHHDGYRIEAFDGPIPDALLESLCACKNRLGVDAPTGAMTFEEEQITPEVHRHREATARRQGRTLLTTVAITGVDEVVAYNELVILEPPNPNVSQWGTLVRAEHRGRRLGLAVKARGIKELQARVGPHVRRVSTCNAEQNQHMVAINERLGFEVVELSPAFQRRLPPEAPAEAPAEAAVREDSDARPLVTPAAT
jgi:GNAT superfamily N-acetyltransferase